MVLPWSAVQALRPADPRHSALGSFGSPSSRVPVSTATLAAALNPTTLAYRLAPLRDPAGTGAPWGYTGANPVAKLHLHLDANGLLLRQQGYPGSLRLALAAVGRDGQFAAAGAVRPAAAAGEIRYSREGLAEWYRNGPLGLEQGFILAAPAAGQGHGPLTLRLHVSGDLAPRLAGAALLLGSHGLRYAGLYASDALGRPLPAHLALGTVPGGWSVGLVVDDRGARYPLTVDPTFTLQSTLPDPGAGADQFGYAVSLSGDGLTALVGARFTPKETVLQAGAAYVFRRATTSVPFPTSPTETLTDPGSGTDRFGAAVVLSADGLTALVGAYSTTAIAGAAYAYRRASTSVPFPTSPTDTLLDPGSGADEFGSSVALSADGLTALVGAIFTAKGATAHAGAAYAYRRASTSAPFPTSPTDTLPDPGSSADNLGNAVALSSDGLTALIGAPNTVSGAGAAYTYRRATTSSPFPTSPLDTLPDPGPSSDDFGFAVALSGDGLTALIGAEGTADGAGAAYAYQSRTTPGRTASTCSLRVGFFSTLGSTNGTSSTQFSLATGKLAGGRRTLINYLSLLGSSGLLRAVPVTSTVTCLLAVTVPPPGAAAAAGGLRRHGCLLKRIGDRQAVDDPCDDHAGSRCHAAGAVGDDRQPGAYRHLLYLRFEQLLHRTAELHDPCPPVVDSAASQCATLLLCRRQPRVEAGYRESGLHRRSPDHGDRVPLPGPHGSSRPSSAGVTIAAGVFVVDGATGDQVTPGQQFAPASATMRISYTIPPAPCAHLLVV